MKSRAKSNAAKPNSVATDLRKCKKRDPFSRVSFLVNIPSLVNVVIDIFYVSPGKMKVDWKYLSAALGLLLALLISGIIQLDPPVNQDSQNLSYPANTWLMLDLLCEESARGSSEAKEMLVKYLEQAQLHEECVNWKNSPDGQR